MKPLFKVVPFEETPADLLERAGAAEDDFQPAMADIAAIVHGLRGVS